MKESNSVQRGLVSSMGKEKIVFKCLQCGYEQIIPNGIDGKRCEKCCGPIRPIRFLKGGEGNGQGKNS